MDYGTLEFTAFVFFVLFIIKNNKVQELTKELEELKK